jgi:putative ABC transport system substrate-binding protein
MDKRLRILQFPLTCLSVLALLLISIRLAEAQLPKVHRVGVLYHAGDTPALKGLREGLKEAGYIEEKNLLLDINLNKTPAELHSIAKRYKEKKIDVIVAIGSTATTIAKGATQEIPIVFMFSSDPVRSGFVKSQARPETHITGLAAYTDYELQGKRLEVFKEAVPTLRRVAVLYDARAGSEHHARSFELVRKLAPSLGLKLAAKPIKSTAEVDETLASLSNVDGIFIICGNLFQQQVKKIAATARERKLPLTGCPTWQIDEPGVLVRYETDVYRIGHRAAWYVDRILRGAKPQDLPVEAPTRFELTLNLNTAKQIGLTIPPDVLARADRVIR